MRVNSNPRAMGVVGAGIVGLSTAWFLQERGVEVTVFDRTGPAGGASRGNAGWITPSLSTPLPEPAIFSHGIRRFFRPTSPLYVPYPPGPDLVAFLARLARNSTRRRWRASMRSLVHLNGQALDAYDMLAADGVDHAPREADPFVIGCVDPSEAEAFLTEARRLGEVGQQVLVERLAVAEARAMVPLLSTRIRAALRLGGQRRLDPAAFVTALAERVIDRGGVLRVGREVTSVRDRAGRTEVTAGDLAEEFDGVVLAGGASLNALAGEFGVRARVRAGRGYSFTVAAEPMPPGPVYFPAASVVCTPLGDRMRIAGMMEFRPDDAPLDTRRIAAIVESVRPLLQGVNLDDRRDEWVGSRPCTADGLPLIGRTTSPRVFVAGGHGMEGMTLGPATGRLLAESICTDTVPNRLMPFDPLR
ncbi:NAD(P)/FAD-dependent oxidoreductase [Speluncibacter jeojiensis]